MSESPATEPMNAEAPAAGTDPAAAPDAGPEGEGR